MPSVKHRVNLSVPAQVDRSLQRLARRDNIPVSTKALELLQYAIGLEEDEALLAVAEEREARKAAFVSHEKAWG